MTGLLAGVPAWAAGYIGIPYRPMGRTRRLGLDCWGLLRLVLAERAGIHLPSHAGDYLDPHDAAVVAGLLANPDERASWQPVAAGGEQALDVAEVLRPARLADGVRLLPVHVAVVVAPGWALTTDAGVGAHLWGYRHRNRLRGVCHFHRHRQAGALGFGG